MDTLSQHIESILTQGIKAPSGHNTQPWSFAVLDNKIWIKPDFRRALPCVDPHHRELYISLGCCLANIQLAAHKQGYNTHIECINADGIQISIVEAHDPQLNNSSLFATLDLTQTNRRIFNHKLIDQTQLSKLIKEINMNDDVVVYNWPRQSVEFEQLKTAILASNSQQMAKPNFIAELKHWIRYNRAHALKTNDGLSAEVFGAPNLPCWLSKIIMSHFLNSTVQNRSDVKKIDSCSHLVLLSTTENALNQWTKLGVTLQYLLLNLTAHNIAYSYMNQPCEEITIANELRRTLPINSNHPTILLRIGYAEKMPYSKRRPLSDVLKN